MIDTEIGPAHVISAAILDDGSPGWYVVYRRKDFADRPWPWKGSFVFAVVAKL